MNTSKSPPAGKDYRYDLRMCGICGNFGELRFNSLSTELILENLKHRGPDDSKIYTFENLTLGHCRLSIQDPTNSIQPMQSSSGKSVISYNGEIYNLGELRTKLPTHAWKTSGDTEVLVELLEEYGFEILQEVEGMFAIAFWDTESKALSLIRDQMGEKPLYFSLIEKSMVFSSELKSMLPSNACIKDVDKIALAHFLKYLYFPVDRTILPFIQTVMPGECVTFSSLGELTRFSWKTKGRVFSIPASQNLKSILRNVVMRTLVSDVPVGVMLSGGIDSSIIALEAKHSHPNLKTFSVRMPGHSEDADYAEIMAKELKTDHHVVEFRKSEMAALILEVLSNTPQPFGDTSIIPVFHLAKCASSEVKVLLSGDGADELFAGYAYYDKYFNLESQRSKTNTYFNIGVLNLLQLLGMGNKKEFIQKKLKHRMESGIESPRKMWDKDLSILPDKSVGQMLRQNISISKFGVQDFLNVKSVLSWDLASYLPGDLLFKSDSGGMMASVEIRAPFLNPEVVEFAHQLKLKELQPNKGFLKETYTGVLPNSVLTRKKQGFGGPITEWFAIPEVNDMASTYLFDRSRGIFQELDFNRVRKIATKSAIARWNLLALSIWVEHNLVS